MTTTSRRDVLKIATAGRQPCPARARSAVFMITGIGVHDGAD